MYDLRTCALFVQVYGKIRDTRPSGIPSKIPALWRSRKLESIHFAILHPGFATLHLACGANEMNQIGERPLGAQASPGSVNGFDHLSLKAFELLPAQCAVGGLEGGAKKERVLARTKALIAKDFAGTPLDQLRDLQRGDCMLNCFPRDAFVKNERE